METDATRIVRSASGDSRWELADRTPRAPLRPYVRRIAGYDERSARPQRQRQFPEPYVVLIVDFGPTLRVRLGGARSTTRHAGGFVAGIGDAFADVEHTGCQRGVQVDLTPTGARRFLGLPLSELDGRVVALWDLLPPAERTLLERLDGCRDWSGRLDLVEALLARRIHASPLDTRLVDAALSRIESAGGRLAIGALARELGYSRKHLIARFRDQVGVTPKLQARLVRFSRLMSEVGGGPPRGFAELALEHGYSDQAHLAREVRGFTGLTPTAARAHLIGLGDLLG